MRRPWPRFPFIVVRPPGWRVGLLVLLLTALAAAWSLLFGDVDAFEERTGLFDRIGSFLINALVALTGFFAALWALSVLFPRRWGEKAGLLGAMISALLAFFCFRVLWLGGV